MDQAYKNFFKTYKSKGRRYGFPKFKSKRHGRASYTTKSNPVDPIDC